MRGFMLAIALAIASTSAFGYETQDYTFKVLVQTGQAISGYQLAQLTDPAINDLNNVIFTAYAKAPIGSSTFFAGLFSPEAQIAPLQDHPITLASLRMPSTMRIRLRSSRTTS